LISTPTAVEADFDFGEVAVELPSGSRKTANQVFGLEILPK